MKNQKNSQIFWLGLLVIVFVLAEFAAGESPWAGSGDANDPYQIWDATDVNSLGEDPNYYSAHFKLMADVDMSGFSYAKAVIARDGSPSFTGEFDGDGYKIINLTIDTGGAGNNYLGLFGKISTGASVKNLGLVNIVITGGATSNYVGGLVGYNNRGEVTNCYSKGSVTGNSDVGGLVGMNNGGTISKCYSVGMVSGSLRVGGLAGRNPNILSNISKCYSTASVVGDILVGGLCGENTEGYVSDSYATGMVSGTSDVGGLLGRNDSEESMHLQVSHCYSSGRVIGDQYLGGLIGYSLGGTCGYSYWDKWTSGQAYSAGGTGKTTPEMHQEATYSEWDFDDTWFLIEDVIYPIHFWTTTVYIGDLNLDGVVDFKDVAILCGNWLVGK
jgi:hypothetical protein